MHESTIGRAVLSYTWSCVELEKGGRARAIHGNDERLALPGGPAAVRREAGRHREQCIRRRGLATNASTHLSSKTWSNVNCLGGSCEQMEPRQKRQVLSIVADASCSPEASQDWQHAPTIPGWD